MAKKQNKLIERRIEDQYSVKSWRERWKALKKRLPSDWIDRIALIDSSLDSLAGARTFKQVSLGRASLERTVHIVTLCEKMLSQLPVAASHLRQEKAREESHKRQAERTKERKKAA